MRGISIRKSPSADSRTAKGPVSVEELTRSTMMHIDDVKNSLNWIAELIQERGSVHDHTKMEMMDEFHAALTSGHIKDTEWYKKHITQERHHLKSNVPNDVNLIDIIEHVCDCVMAGMARSGEVYDVDIPAETLTLALRNTVELLKSSTYVIDESKDIMDEEV